MLAELGAHMSPVTETGATPLHFAAASGDFRAVVVLLAHGAAVDATEPEWGQTPLMFAAALGRTKAVTALLEAGADATITARVMDLVERDIMDRASERRRRTEVAAMRGGTDAQSYPVESGVAGRQLQSSAAPVTSREEQARQAAQEALDKMIEDWTASGRAKSFAVPGNAAEVFPELVRRGVLPDVVTDQTSAHDTGNGYLPAGWTLAEWSATRES